MKGRRRLLLVAMAALLAAAWLAGAERVLSADTLAAHRAALVGFVAARPVAAAAAYVAFYAAVVALSVPGAVWLTLAGGFLFGPVVGAALTTVAATLGATAVFLLARRLAGEAPLARFGPRGEALAAALRRDAAGWLLALRLLPVVPFVLVNLVPAFVGVPLPVYVATTFIGILPATILYSLAGAGIGRVLEGGEAFSPAAVWTPEILGGVCGLALLALLALPLRRRFAAPPNQDIGQSGGGRAR